MAADLVRWRFEPRVYCAGLTFPEGPTWHQDALWVTDVSAGGVHQLRPDGGTRTFLSDRRGMGGLVVTRDGDMIASGRDLVRVTDGQVVRSRPPGSSGLNDLGTDATGALYAGVLTFRPAHGEEPTPGAVARLTSAGDDWFWWRGPAWPNGIITVPDGGMVVADFETGQLWRHQAGGDWQVLATSATGHVDGLAADNLGRIWAATGPGSSVECWSPDGTLLGAYPIEAAFVSSVCFGGVDLATMFVTIAGHPHHGGAVLAASAAAPGAPLVPAVL